LSELQAGECAALICAATGGQSGQSWTQQHEHQAQHDGSANRRRPGDSDHLTVSLMGNFMISSRRSHRSGFAGPSGSAFLF